MQATADYKFTNLILKPLLTYAPARNIYLLCQSRWDIALFWLKELSSDSAGFTVTQVSQKALNFNH